MLSPRNCPAIPSISNRSSRWDQGSSLRKTACCSCLPAEVGQLTGQFSSAAPLIEIMAGDPSIRGLTGALETGLAGVKRGQVKLDNTERAVLADRPNLEDVLNKGSATFSWRELVSDKPLTDSDRRAFIEFKPILDFNALEPGKDATDAIRQAAVDLNFAGQYGSRVRLTGPVPIANEEFATVADGAVVNGVGTRAGRACHPLDGAAFGEDHLRGIRQPLHRPFHHHRGRPDDGGFAEPVVDRLRRAVRRTGRGFRYPVQRPLPLRAFQRKTT